MFPPKAKAINLRVRVVKFGLYPASLGDIGTARRWATDGEGVMLYVQLDKRPEGDFVPLRPEHVEPLDARDGRFA